MTKLAASGLATAFALVMLGGSAVRDFQHAPESLAQTAQSSQPVDSTPLGRCLIQYDALGDSRHPADMECEHARWVAQRWGGRVMEQTGEGLVERVSYVGRNDFTGVPSSALPRAGWCRAWIDGRAVETQPEQSDCRAAQRIADAEGGRVLYMPL